MNFEDLAGQLRADGRLRLDIKVVPKSAKTEFAGTMDDGTLKIRLAAVPERGKANAELCAFLAHAFGVPQRNVTIVSGETSPRKRIDVVS